MDDGHVNLKLHMEPPLHRNQRMMFMIGINFLELHVITQNVGSIRNPSRFDDCPADVTRGMVMILHCGQPHWDIKLLLSSGSTHCGFGIGIGRSLALEMSHVRFPFFSDTVCALHAPICNVKFHFFLAYLRIAPNQRCRNDLGPHIPKLPCKSELGNRGFLRSTWWKFRNGPV